MPIISVRDNENNRCKRNKKNKTKKKRKTKTEKTKRVTEAIVKGWELNDFALRPRKVFFN